MFTVNMSRSMVSLGEPLIYYGERRVRGRIKGFSTSSAKRLIARLKNTPCKFVSFITLTIPHVENDGLVFKANTMSFLKGFMSENSVRIRSDYSLSNQYALGALWFLEFQQRGAPHLHIFSSFYVDIREVTNLWVEAWDERIKELYGTRLGQVTKQKMEAASVNVKKIGDRESLINYAAKLFGYAAKVEQKDVPAGYRDVGRFWGVRGTIQTYPAYRVSFNEKAYPDEIWLSFKGDLDALLLSHACNTSFTIHDWTHGRGLMVLGSIVSEGQMTILKREINQLLFTYFGITRADYAEKHSSGKQREFTPLHLQGHCENNKAGEYDEREDGLFAFDYRNLGTPERLGARAKSADSNEGFDRWYCNNIGFDPSPSVKTLADIVGKHFPRDGGVISDNKLVE